MNFLIGAATSAHQTEGNNVHSDCWAMERMKNTSYAEPSLSACDSYYRYEEDIRLLKQAGLNAYRFTIEWARIEPEEGELCEEAIAHYKQLFAACKALGITPVVTLHHFSSPKWLISKGGWESEKTVEYFARYARLIAERFGDDLEYVCTINEANMRVQIASMAKKFTVRNLQLGMNLSAVKERAQAAAKEYVEIFGTPNPNVFLSAAGEYGDGIIIKAHLAARKVIKDACPRAKVGITLSLHDIRQEVGGEEDAEKEWSEEFAHYLPYLKDDDFIGVQNYTRTVFGKNGAIKPPEDAELTQMGYEYCPEALENVIKRVYRELKIPVLVTENGIATENDDRRQAFIKTALSGIRNCLNEDIPVLGYLHWSLLDNFEWQKGYSMKFGLVSVNRTTMERTPKRSLYLLGELARKEF